jgi:hypothetical protein
LCWGWCFSPLTPEGGTIAAVCLNKNQSQKRPYVVAIAPHAYALLNLTLGVIKLTAKENEKNQIEQSKKIAKWH